MWHITSSPVFRHVSERTEDWQRALISTVFQIHSTAPEREDILAFLTGANKHLVYELCLVISKHLHFAIYSVYIFVGKPDSPFLLKMIFSLFHSVIMFTSWYALFVCVFNVFAYSYSLHSVFLFRPFSFKSTVSLSVLAQVFPRINSSVPHLWALLTYVSFSICFILSANQANMSGGGGGQ